MNSIAGNCDQPVTYGQSMLKIERSPAIALLEFDNVRIVTLPSISFVLVKI